jgi:hypothetical protein
MSIVWIGVAAGIVLVVVVSLWARFRETAAPVLGTVSDQWLAEQRLNRPDSQR